MTDVETVLRPHAEQQYEAELAALERADDRPRPPRWRLSPWAVTTYLLGGDADGTTIEPKYVGQRRLIELAVATLATVAVLSLLLIPALGATGAALAFAGGQSAACLVLVLGARRAGTTMPLPLADMAGIAGIAAACGAVNAGIGLMPGGFLVPGQVLRMVLLAAGAGAAAWRYDVLGVAGAIRHRLAA